MWSTIKKKKAVNKTETDPEVTHMTELTDKDSKTVIINKYIQVLKGKDGYNEWTAGKSQQRNENCKKRNKWKF